MISACHSDKSFSNKIPAFLKSKQNNRVRKPKLFCWKPNRLIYFKLWPNLNIQINAEGKDKTELFLIQGTATTWWHSERISAGWWARMCQFTSQKTKPFLWWVLSIWVFHNPATFVLDESEGQNVLLVPPPKKSACKKIHSNKCYFKNKPRELIKTGLMCLKGCFKEPCYWKQ